jgi:hypothetical protein
LGTENMTPSSKSIVIAALLAVIWAPGVVVAQSSTSPGTQTNSPSGNCTDSADMNCKPNRNQKEPSESTTGGGVINNPDSNQTLEPAANNNDQTPEANGTSNNASGGNSVSPSGSGNVRGDTAGGPGSAGSSGSNN